MHSCDLAGTRGSRVEQIPAPIKRARPRKPMTSAAAASRENSDTLFATPEIVADRRADGSIWLKSTAPLQAACALRRRLAGALGAADAGQGFSRRARQRRRAVDDGQLPRRAAAGALGGQLDPGARLERAASAGDSLRQQRRSCAVRAGGDACRRARGGDLAGLFAGVEGFRQAQEHDRAARSRRDLCVRHKTVRGGAGGDQAAAHAPSS